MRIWDGAVIRRIVATIEIAFLSALILATRCANYQEVFVGGNIYFADADCYARMTRVKMCAENPGLIVRHHDFENFPQGTTPHTTALFDYLILALSWIIVAARPLVAPYHLDLAGALISPLLALFGGWFLWWWSRRMGFRYRWVMLIVYAISPILVHGTELGRPDHQSLLILLVTIAICAEWGLQIKTADQPSPRGYGLASTAASTEVNRWAVVSGVTLALAMWVSAYEPLVLLAIVTVTIFLMNRGALLARDRRAGWISFAAIIVIALLIERRVPSIAIFQSNPNFENWARTIGELAHLSPVNPVWFRWCGFLLLAAPLLIWMNVRKNAKRRPTNLCAFDRHLLSNHLAGALGILFCVDFCARASGVAHAIQVARSSLDRVCFVDLSDLARLGSEALAERRAIDESHGKTN